MNKESSTSVFVSYAHEDYERIKPIITDLESQGFRVWLDRQEIRVGARLSKEIANAIKASDFFLVCISEASVSSNWILAEVEYAFEAIDKSRPGRIIPLVLEQPKKMPVFLKDIKYVDFTKGYYVSMSELLAVLRVKPHKSAEKDGNIAESIEDIGERIASYLEKKWAVEKPRKRAISKNDDNKLVFVITAFKEDMEPIFEGIAAAAKAVGLMAKRVKDIQGDYRITDKILEMIETSRFVVVDLTHERPNVYFELGYARGIGKRVVTIARRDAAVHFDVKDWTFLSYSDSRTLEGDLKKRFQFELKANGDNVS